MPITLQPEVIEERILALLCFSDEHAVQIEEQIPDDFFHRHEAHHSIFTKIRPFIKQERRAPGAELEALLEIELQRDKYGFTVKTLERLSKLIPGMDAQFITGSLQSLLRSKNIQKLCERTLEDADTDPDAALLELERGIELINDGIHVTDQNNVYDLNQGLPAEELRYIDPSFSSRD